MNEADRFWSKVRRTPNCWEWTAAIDANGYGRFGFRGRNRHAHAVAYELVAGPTDGKCVCHHCDNPPCVRPDHLFLGTPAENHADMMRKGRYVPPRRHKGSQHPNAKLSEDEVRDILASSEPHKTIARTYGVSRGLICEIRQRKRWRHI